MFQNTSVKKILISTLIVIVVAILFFSVFYTLESTIGLTSAMRKFSKGMIDISFEKASAGLVQTFNQAKGDIKVSLQDTTPMLIKNSSASLLNLFQNISRTLQDLW